MWPPKRKKTGRAISFSMFDGNSWGEVLSGHNEAFRFAAPPGRTPFLFPIHHPRKLLPEDLLGREPAIDSLRRNLDGFSHDLPPLPTLLYGHRGTGKTSTVAALWNEWNIRKKESEPLRLLQVDKPGIDYLAPLIDLLSTFPQLFIVLLDDLAFGEEDDSFRQMKAILDGGIMASPVNVALIVTSNIRHLVSESRQGLSDALHPQETRDDALALYDRFGLTLFFDEPDQETYFRLVLSKAASAKLLSFVPDNWLSLWTDWQKATQEVPSIPEDPVLLILTQAQRFSRDRGSRSGRTAQQFVDLLRRRMI